MADLIGDIGRFLGVGSAENLAQNSTSRKGNTELNMDDFLQLMIVQLTNQTMDDTMDTSEMMNQFLQMQMITTMANMNEISIQSYANSLVGKKVTIGVVHDNVLEERELFVYGTGTYNGQQVIFCEDGNMYYLSQIMAVGVLPDQDGNYTIGGSGGTEDPSGEEESYIYTDDDGKETTVYVGEDGKAGTEDDWYYATGEDGEVKKVFVGPDGIPGGGDDIVYDGSQGVPDGNEDE